MRYDLAVVGNGPAGCLAAAKNLSQKDIVLVGGGERRIQCAGLISKSGLERIGVEPGDSVLNRIRGAKIYSPGMVEVLVDAKSTKAYAVDRAVFDSMLLDQAVNRGVTYVDDWVTGYNGFVDLRYGGRIKTSKVVLATGTDYSLQKKGGIPHPTEFLVGGQYEMKVECDPDFVELYFNVPGFFSWIIPLGETARVGLAVKSNPRPYLDGFVSKLSSEGRILSNNRFSESFGVIPVHDPSVRAQIGDVVTVGDAAGQVKASTGGGIVYAGICAEYVADGDYESKWRQTLGLELKLHLMIHRLLNRLDEKAKDRLFKAVAESRESLIEGGDMDSAYKSISAMLGDPRFLFKALVNLPWLFYNIL